MFAFENWHSALEMKLYIRRYIHHIGGLPDFSALRFTRYNQYESMILPMVKYLEGFGVQFHYNAKVENVDFAIGGGMGPVRQHTGTGQDTILKKQAESGVVHAQSVQLADQEDGHAHRPDRGGWHDPQHRLGRERSGVHHQRRLRGELHHGFAEPSRPHGLRRSSPAAAGICGVASPAQDPSFGHPDVFCSDPEHSKWMSATVTTLDDEIPPYIQKICKRDPFSGTCGDRRHRHRRGFQLADELDAEPPAAVPRPAEGPAVRMGVRSVPRQARQLCEEADAATAPARRSARSGCTTWACRPTRSRSLAKNHANTVPVMMPYIDAFFMPRSAGDRPDVVPDGAVNFAFLGQFAETPRDTIFTTEYSMRTGMEAVYTLLRRGPRRAGGVGFASMTCATCSTPR